MRPAGSAADGACFRGEGRVKAKHFFTSLTRISDLPKAPFTVQPLSRREWETGDYVVGRSPHPRAGCPRSS